MDALAALEWRAPAGLLLILAPLALLAWRRRHGAEQRLERYAEAHLLRRLLIGATPGAGSHKLLLLAWLLAAVAAAGPYWTLPDTPAENARGVDLAIIIDISPSMAAADISPTRLARAQRELRDLVELLPNSRYGLVVFSANAYTTLPLTSDRAALLHSVDLLEPWLTVKHGSNVARALELTARLLEESPQDARAALLISDGELPEPDALTAARQLGARGIPLYTLGLGSASGAPVPSEDGHFIRQDDEVVISRLDRPRLHALAAATGGELLQLNDDDSEWQEMVEKLQSRMTASITLPSTATRQLFPLFLGLSLMLFVWSGARRYATLALAPLTLLILPLDNDAMASETRAYAALQAGDYAQAERLYRDMDGYSAAMGLGAAAYRQSKWPAALAAFERAAQHGGDEQTRAEALYNAGNALARLQRFKEASDIYTQALHLAPNFNKAALNLSLVNELLETQRGERASDDADQDRPPLASGGADGAAPRGQGQDAQAASAQPPRPGGEQQNAPSQQTGLRAALSQWQQQAAGDGALAGADLLLDALSDRNGEYLRWRFREQDFGPNTKVIEDRPW